ncbi:MAG: TlpA family protein disulfide reductase [Acidimicrobiales bacterium]
MNAHMAAKKSKKSSAPSPRRKGLGATGQWAIIIGIGVAIVGVLVFNGVRDAADDGGDGVTTVADWDLPALDEDADPDGRVRLADFEGTPTVVNFFASWCTACDDELPDFRETALALEGQVDFVFVNTIEPGDWRPMAERNDIEQFPLAKDIKGNRRDGLYRNLRGTGGLPMTAFYDANGNLVDTIHSEMNAASLDQQLRALGFV